MVEVEGLVKMAKDLGEDLVGNGVHEFEGGGRRRDRLGKRQELAYDFVGEDTRRVFADTHQVESSGKRKRGSSCERGRKLARQGVRLGQGVQTGLGRGSGV